MTLYTYFVIQKYKHDINIFKCIYQAIFIKNNKHLSQNLMSCLPRPHFWNTCALRTIINVVLVFFSRFLLSISVQLKYHPLKKALYRLLPIHRLDSTLTESISIATLVVSFIYRSSCSHKQHSAVFLSMQEFRSWSRRLTFEANKYKHFVQTCVKKSHQV